MKAKRAKRLRLQVYALLISNEPNPDDRRILITRKAFINDRFKVEDHGKRWHNPEGVINQAGQYALPGGKLEHDRIDESTIKATASTETMEELGIDISSHIDTATVTNHEGFSTVMCSVTPEEFTELHRLAGDNIAHGRISEEHREHQEILAVPIKDLNQYLGAHKELAEEEQRYADIIEQRSRADRYSQAIDWYGEIAQDVQRRTLQQIERSAEHRRVAEVARGIARASTAHTETSHARPHGHAPGRTPARGKGARDTGPARE